jgi:hypothetical protein
MKAHMDDGVYMERRIWTSKGNGKAFEQRTSFIRSPTT